MSKFLLFVLCLSFSITSFAQKVSKINADYRCETEEGGIAFKVGDVESRTARVWQTDSYDDYGLELFVSEFNVQRCPHCFTFSAYLGPVKLTGDIKDGVLNYKMYDPETGSFEILLKKMPCVVVKR